jgi:hypothetical protein
VADLAVGAGLLTFTLGSLPIARSAVLIGRTAADLATNAVTLIVMLALGIAIGFRPSQPAYQVALAFLLVLAFAYVFSWISAFVGVSVRNPEAAQSVGFSGSSRSCSPPRRSFRPPTCREWYMPSLMSTRSRLSSTPRAL